MPYDRQQGCVLASSPENVLLVLGVAYLVATWLLSRDSNPDHEGMNLVCYLCTTQLYYKAHYVAFSIPKTDASNELLSVPFLYKYYIKIFKESQISLFSFCKWYGWRDSNPRPRGPKPRLLATELHPCTGNL